jgi:hypothetical protein
VGVEADQSFGVEVTKCLADGRCADLEFLGQIGLDEAGAALEVSVEYGAPQRLTDELVCRLARLRCAKAGT